jgi:hypothetical protein
MVVPTATSHWNNPSGLILLTSIDCALGYLSGSRRAFLTAVGLPDNGKKDPHATHNLKEGACKHINSVTLQQSDLW